MGNDNGGAGCKPPEHGHRPKDKQLPQADSRYCRSPKTADHEDINYRDQSLEESRQKHRQGEIDNPAADRDPLCRVVQDGVM